MYNSLDSNNMGYVVISRVRVGRIMVFFLPLDNGWGWARGVADRLVRSGGGAAYIKRCVHGAIGRLGWRVYEFEFG